jgi:lipopolysaccharide cholinephosphotransferase
MEVIRMFNTGETAEELKEKYNPEGGLRRKVQLRLLDMLIYFDKICKEINVDYRLDSGNILGAVRHGGFIPWDDDLDVAIENYGDYKRLCDYLKTHPHPQFVLQDDTTDQGHIKYWNTLRDLKSEYIHLDEGDDLLDKMLKYRGLQIDIFPFEAGVIPSLYFRYANLNRIEKWALLEHKHYKVKIIRLFRKKIINPLLHIASRLFGDKHFYMHSYGAAFKARIPKDVLLPHRPIMFEGLEFPGPADPQKYCEVVYGNFMDLPPVDKRDHHLVTYKIWD